MLAHYLRNAQDRTAIVNTASLVLNIFIGIGKLVLGLYLLSGWFITNALYYLILCAAKGQALHMYAVAKKIESPEQKYDLEFSVYKRSGFFLCLLGVSYMLVCLRMYLARDVFIFDGFIVYLVATIAFTKLAVAIYGNIVYRQLKNPIISTLKMFNFIDAMVSIVVTQTTLLTMQASPYAISVSALFGMACSALFFLIGIYMLYKKKKESLTEEEGVDPSM
ncbi:hypothetical protein [Paenibacillus sp. Leaf72]|uniref:hypothetical protein n=1 Tax=Paenibacillus sp. Leaf72 TaxID=1736234 RepID=UPI0006FA2BC9|nr:hypothetical protein [Paenibacillus sp. Leaf72]KQN99856.1 hypothetical protein ASF12_16815 [Paenibacillus sp. Leaf72]